MRLISAGVPVGELDALFVTHHHSDHLTGLVDLAMTRWIFDRTDDLGPLLICTPEGASARYVERMLEPWVDDLAVRKQHTGRTTSPQPDLITFPVPDEPTEVWTSGPVSVKSMQVRHEPVQGAVGYRVDGPGGSVAITGDTLVCDEVAELASGVDVLVYEALRFSLLNGLGSTRNFVLDYHADTVEIGRQAQALAVPILVLTHLIPPPRSEAEEQGFIDEVRSGGYEGEVIVANDLTSVEIPGTA